jgi:hypothetical protein
MLIRKVVLMLALGLTCSSAMAEWALINSSDASDDYVNRSSIRKTVNKAKMWSLTDFKIIQKDSDVEKPYLSEALLFEYDCKNETTKLLSISVYSDNMQRGVSVASFSYPSPASFESAPNSINELKWKIACGKH